MTTKEPYRIYLVEDDRMLAEEITRLLMKWGYEVRSAQWIACQAGIIILTNLVLLTSTPLAKTLGEIFYLDLLVICVAAAGYFLHFRRMDRAYGRVRQTMADGQDPGWLFKELSDKGEDTVPGISLMHELLACSARE